MTMSKTMHGANQPRTRGAVGLFMGTVCSLTLAADGTPGPPPISGGATAATSTATSAADGAPIQGNGEEAVMPSMGMEPMFLILVVFGGIILFSVFGQRKEKKRRKEMLSSIKKNDSVQTLGGIIGSVVELKNETVVIRVDDRTDTRMTFSRAAVSTVLSKPDATDD